MIIFTNEVHINQPIGAVYAYLSDLEHTPEWNWAITKTTKTTPGPVAVGSRYRQIRTVPRKETEYLEVVGLDPNRTLEIRGTLAGMPAELTYEFERVDRGTRVANTVSLQPRGTLRLMAPAFARRIKHAVAENLDALKSNLDNGDAT